ncbi:hypothetical protein [Psychrobacter sp. KH172YL61]|uniref:hypothetical protein n=1 Tax=Psychrobacter sp. KH172YL61 TaxID=2517899 RepID=UPI003FA7A7B0
MRGGAETIRANSGGISAFKTAVNGSTDSITIDGVTITKDSCVKIQLEHLLPQIAVLLSS